MKLVSIIYDSSAVTAFSEDDLVSLLKQACENNARVGVTGLLLYKDGNFMQVIEGEERAVEKLFSTIEQDERHTGCTQLLWEVIKERRFPDWSMGFKDLGNVDVRKTPGYTPFLDEPLTSKLFQKDSSRALKLLMAFRAE